MKMGQDVMILCFVYCPAPKQSNAAFSPLGSEGNARRTFAVERGLAQSGATALKERRCDCMRGVNRATAFTDALARIKRSAAQLFRLDCFRFLRLSPANVSIPASLGFACRLTLNAHWRWRVEID